MDETIRLILGEYAGLVSDARRLADDDDLYQLGLSSHGTVNVMLALEDAFAMEFPDRLIRKSTFQSVSAIRAAVIAATGHE